MTQNLLPQAFTPLPLGTVLPTGWLHTQLRIQADGLSGHLEEFWPDVAESAWVGGSADGWERGPYWLDGVIPLAFLLQDDHLIARATHWVNEILARQTDDGWLGTTSDLRLNGDRRANLSHAYDPWPRFIVLKALTQFHEATGDPRIIPAMTRFLSRLHELSQTNWLRSWARFRWADLVVSIYWLHDRTGDDWLLDLAANMHRQGVDWVAHINRLPVRDRALPEERDLSTHVVNNAMGLKAPGVWYRQSHDATDRDAIRTAIATMDAHHGQATGVFTGDEHLAGRNPSQGTELCAVVEYMYSLEVLLAISGDPWLADRLEQIAYNALPATFSPNMWHHQYVQQVNQVISAVSEDRVYTSNGPDANVYGLEPHFGCCTANMHQGWPKFAANTWMASPDGGLAAVTWAPVTIATEVNGTPVRLDVATNYPFEGSIHLTVTTEGETTFPLHLRIPEWAKGATVALDGRTHSAEPGTFHVISQTWRGVTEITLTFPLAARLETRDHGSVSLHRGPILFALPIGEDWQYLRGEQPHADYELHPTTPWNYALIDPEAVLETLTFETTSVTSTPGSEPNTTTTDASTIMPTNPGASTLATPFAPETAPVAVTLTARRVDGWTIERNAAGPLPQSPLAPTSAAPTTPESGIGSTETATAAVETIRLIPYGSTNLRIAQFPVTKQ